MGARKRRAFRLTRDLVTYAVGITLIVVETFRNGTDRPSLLLLFGAMIALPQVVGRDEKSAPPPSPPAPPEAPTQPAPPAEGEAAKP
jgi:hypothetical protein